MQHLRTKHIEVRHHFIRDHIEKGNVTLSFILTENQQTEFFQSFQVRIIYDIYVWNLVC